MALDVCPVLTAGMFAVKEKPPRIDRSHGGTTPVPVRIFPIFIMEDAFIIKTK
jgi:hypothetical protein